MTTDLTRLKQQAADHAVKRVRSGMVLGLGHGSTAVLAVRRIGQLLAEQYLTDLVGIPASTYIAEEAERLGIPLTTLDAHPVIDLTIDGADEVDPNLDVIKGGGGALLREKLVAQASRQVAIIVDETKLSPQLGTRWAVPVEVIPFGWSGQKSYIESLGATVEQRMDGDGVPFLTDHGNYILDCNFGPIEDAVELAGALKQRTGVVEHGLFIGLTTTVIAAGADGIQELNS
jgi:ribose 5-phosphate isomerase A